MKSAQLAGMLAAVLGVVAIPHAWATTTIKVDIEPSTGSTASGYVAMTRDYRFDNSTELSLGDGISIGWVDYCTPGYRDRGASYPNLLTRDMVSWSSSNGPETLDIRGLAAGDYDLTIYATDPQYPDKRTSFAIDSDNDGSADTTIEIHNPSGEHDETIAVSVSAAGVLSVTIDGVGGASGAINGLDLVGGAAPDTTPPAAVSDLGVTGSATDSLTLQWTAPADDLGAGGAVTSYDVRYSTSTIDEGNWASATQVAGEPTPASPGQTETFTVAGLSDDTQYYVALKSSDGSSNISALSNVTSGTTLVDDTTPPAAITDLAVSNVQTNQVTLTWTAVGDDGQSGTASTYDVRYSTSAIVDDSDFASATQAMGVPAPQASGSPESFAVTGLTAGTTYWFAIKVSDEAANWSALSNVPSATTESGAGPSVEIHVDIEPSDATTAAGYVQLDGTSRWDNTTQLSLGDGIGIGWLDYCAAGTRDRGASYPNVLTRDMLHWYSGTEADTLELRGLGAGEYDLTLYATDPQYPDKRTRFSIDQDHDGSADVTIEIHNLSGEHEETVAVNISSAGILSITVLAIDGASGAINGLDLIGGAAADTTPPAAVADLTAIGSTTGSVTLEWTAPADDLGSGGTVAAYDLRYSTSTIDEANWASATQVSGEPTPNAPGQTEQFTVTGLSAGTQYYFALKSSDAAANVSALSNVTSGTTQAADTTPPAAITDLAVSDVQTYDVTLTWTAVGDDGQSGTAASYHIRYSTSAITDDSDFQAATAAGSPPTPQPGGSAESFNLTGLSAGTTYWFAIKVSDEVPNTSGLSNIPSATTSSGQAAVEIHVDMEPAGSSTASGYVQLTGANRWDNATQVSLGDGVSIGWLDYFGAGSRDRGATYPDLLTRDFMTWYSSNDPETVEIRGLPGGNYDLTIYATDPQFPDKRTSFAIDQDDDGSPDTTVEIHNPSAEHNKTVAVNVSSAGVLAITVDGIGGASGSVNGLDLVGGEPDVVPPAAVTDLTVTDIDTTTIALQWTAPADDSGTGGTVASYDLRYSTSTIDESNWASATPTDDEPTPATPGQTDTCTVTGLAASTQYYFALKSADASSNVSPLSNVPNGSTGPPDLTPPAPIADLAIGQIGVHSVELTWTATGDDGATGQASQYDVRYATSAITDDADFAAASQPTGEPTPQAPGSTESFAVTGLTADTTYWFAIKVSDEVPNTSSLSNVPSATTESGGVFYVTSVSVSDVTSTAVSYGKVWTGKVTYDVSSTFPEIWTWLEVSLDGGNTWHHNQAHCVGYVGTIAPGVGLEIQWLMDTAADVDVQTDAQFRVRVNEDPAYYIQHDTAVLDTVADSPDECPKPISQVDPYTMLEMMVSKPYHQHDLTDLGIYRYQLPGLEQQVSVASGTGMLVGMGVSDRPPSTYPSFEHLKFKATYIKIDQMEFGIISKNSIRNTVEVVNTEKQAIEDALGIPKEHIIINWCHVHYTDNGELGSAESIAALTQAKANAVPVETAVLHIRTGAGYNYTRQGSSGGYTDGPIDDNLFCVLFRDLSSNPVGSWIRFTGHGVVDASNLMCREMESRWGGVCAFMNGNAGTINVARPAEGGNFEPVHMVDLIMAEAPSAQFESITKMGVAWAWTSYYGVDTLIQCTRLGDFYLPVYFAEPPCEQALTTAALLSYDKTIVVGYGNGRAGPGGGYYFWNKTNGIPRWEVYRMTQETVRAANILELALGQ